MQSALNCSIRFCFSLTLLWLQSPFTAHCLVVLFSLLAHRCAPWLLTSSASLPPPFSSTSFPAQQVPPFSAFLPSSSSVCLPVSCLLHSSQDFCASLLLLFIFFNSNQATTSFSLLLFSAGDFYCKYRRDKLPVLSYKTGAWAVPGPAQRRAAVAGRVLFSPRLQQSLSSLHKPQLFFSKVCNLSSRYSQGWWLVYPQTIPPANFQVLTHKNGRVLKKRKTAIIFNISTKSLFPPTSYVEATKTFLTAIFRGKNIFAWGGHLVGKLQPNNLNWQLWTVLNKIF